MSLTRRQLMITLFITGIYLLAQVLVGTEVKVASLFSIAIFFGILSVFAGGGLRSAFGCLNATLIGKFVLIGIAIKILFLEPSDAPLRAPETTALVMAIGFGGVFLGTAIQSRLHCPQVFSVNRPLDAQMLLSFSIVLFVCTYLGYFTSLVTGQTGISHILGSLKSLSIVPPMLYLWKIRTDAWMTHPLILGLLVWTAGVGIFSTGKQEAMEPLALYLVLGFLRYGWKDLRLWSLLSLGLLYYGVIIYPYSQYVRYAGGRKGSFEERLQATTEGFLRITGDQEFRSTVLDHVSKDTYFDPSLAAFSRLAMVGEADRLIYATEQQRSYTGWETIYYGFQLLMPSFLCHDKPLFVGNYLAHIAGDLGASDITTEVSYGVMANLYNAFSLLGVLVGTPVLFGGLYYWIRIFLGEPRWEGLPTASSLWFLWLMASFHHSIAEASVPAIIASLSFPAIIVSLLFLAKWLCCFLPQEAPGRQVSLLSQS